MIADIVTLLAVGALAGFCSGLLGIGGGVIIVPALVALAALHGRSPLDAFPVAVATSSVVIVVNSLTAVSAHWKRGAVDRAWLARIGPWCLLGAMGGAWLTQALERAWVVGAVSLVQLVLAALILLSTCATAGTPGADAGAGRPPRGTAAAGGGLTIGAASALAGIGGGVLLTPFMTLRGMAVQRASGTASALGLAIGGGASLIFALVPGLSGGRSPLLIDMGSAVLLSVGGAAAARAGVLAAHVLPRNLLKRVLAGVLAASAVAHSAQAAGALGPASAQARRAAPAVTAPAAPPGAAVLEMPTTPR